MNHFKVLNEHISKRKSTRRFKPSAIEVEKMQKIEAMINALEPLIPGGQIDFKIVNGDEMKGVFAVKSPHYVVASANKVDGHLMNVGFMLQQLDLFVSSLHLAGCWVGMAKPSKEVLASLPNNFIIAYAFGEPEGVPHQPLEAFNRLPLDQIAEGNFHTDILQSARLAPSATNSQPWYFISKENKIDVYRVKNNPLKAFILDKMNQVDIGIALCHMMVAAKSQDINFKCGVERQNKVDAIQGYYYMISCELEKK